MSSNKFVEVRKFVQIGICWATVAYNASTSSSKMLFQYEMKLKSWMLQHVGMVFWAIGMNRKAQDVWRAIQA